MLDSVMSSAVASQEVRLVEAGFCVCCRPGPGWETCVRPKVVVRPILEASETLAMFSGLENPTLAYFDTRKHLCETVGGFKHGDVIRVGAISAVTIGVKRDGHRLFLWFHPPHSPGDFLIHGG